MAHRSLGRYWHREWRNLLVPDEAFSSGRRRFPLGAASGAAGAGPAESLRYAARTISAHRGGFRAAVSAPASGTRRRNFLGDRFRAAGVRSYPSQLHGAADFFCLSVLGGNSDGAVVTDHRRQRVLSAAVAGDHGKTASWTARVSHAAQLARSDCLCGCGAGEPRTHAGLALAMVEADRKLPALHSTARSSRTAAPTGAAALPGSRCAAAFFVGAHAAALVLRQLYSLADSAVAARNCVDCL